MDKTTTWLIRGASLIIIVFGSIAFNDYLQAKRTLKEVEVATKENLKQQEAIERCKSVQQISLMKYSDLVEEGQIKRLIISKEGPFSPYLLIKTKSRTVKVVNILDQELMNKLIKQNVDIKVLSPNDYIAQCK